MLEKIDLSKSLSKADHKARMKELGPRLQDLQYRMRRAKVPAMVVFEGWDCAGKGEAISLLAEIMDPRNFKVHPIFEPTPEEEEHPFLWRFWTKAPADGEIALFDRSWYQRVLTERIDRTVTKTQWKRGYEQISVFERQLADSGVLMIKFFLHVSKKEQRRRFKEFEADPVEAWRVRPQDWEHHRNYDQFVDAAEEMFLRTDSHYAPWVILPAEDRRYAEVKIAETLVARMEQGLAAAEARDADRPSQSNPKPPKEAGALENAGPTEPSILDRVDLSLSVPRKEYRAELRSLQTELRLLVHQMSQAGIPSVIVYQGWDAAGKGGNIKRLTARLDPRHYDVYATGKPSGDELTHHYLWRFWKNLPRDGHMAVYDRSWYGRVLVERVEGFCSEEEWRRAYQEINEFEQQVSAHGTVIVKFFIHIDRDEQERRFKARQKDPLKGWKITEEDWRNREKWPLYEPATVEMLTRTSTPHAPWTIVPGNDKPYARLMALRTVIERFQSALGEREQKLSAG